MLLQEDNGESWPVWACVGLLDMFVLAFIYNILIIIIIIIIIIIYLHAHMARGRASPIILHVSAPYTLILYYFLLFFWQGHFCS